MRTTTGNLLSVPEMLDMNQLVMVLLMTIQGVTEDIGEKDAVSGVSFLFTRTGHDKQFNLDAFARVSSMEKDITLDTKRFYPPEGCKVDNVFDFLASQINLFALILTQGEFGAVDTNVVKTVNDYGPTITYRIEVKNRN